LENDFAALETFAQPGRNEILPGPASPGEHFSSGVHRAFKILEQFQSTLGQAPNR
jgi:hypothetical protein